VYRVEQRDAAIALDTLSVGDLAGLAVRHRPDLPAEIAQTHGSGFDAVPYYAWANRGPGPMRVWLRNEA